MDRLADLDSALNFVIRRIGEQASLSGEPLSAEQLMLLNYLPTSSPSGGDDTLVPRYPEYDHLRSLAKAAYISDRRANPAYLDWEFAFAVFALNSHPVWGLLNGAGVRHRRRLTDQVLLLFAAFLLVLALLFLAYYGRWSSHDLEIVGSGCLIVLALIYSASARIERHRLENEIESYRFKSRFIKPQ